MPHHGPEVIAKVLARIDAGETQGQVTRDTGIPQPTISRWLKQRRLSGSLQSEPGAPDEEIQAIETVHSGSPPGSPTTALQRVELPGEPGLPDIARQSNLDELKTRVEVLEAFIATLQQQPTSRPGSPNGSPVLHQAVHSGSPSGSPTHKRGFVMHNDVFAAIHAYAAAHHLQVKEVVDLALRTFCAEVGEAVSDA